MGGLLSRGKNGGGSGGGGQRNTEPMQSKAAPMPSNPQEESGQIKAQEQQPEPQQQPPTQAPVETQSSQIVLPKVQQQAAQQSPLKGLADDPVAAATPTKQVGDPIPEPAKIVNNTATPTPTARPMDEQLGATPVILAQDGVQNQLMDSGSNRQLFPFQEANPSRQPDLPNQSYSADQGYRYEGPTTVDGALPSRKYRSRV